MRRLFRHPALAAMLLIAGALAAPAHAAPQALALVATEGGTALHCAGGTCSAEFSAFCLQPDRASPPRGTAYRLADAQPVTVFGTTGDGRRVSLDPARALRIESLRSHVAVRVSLDASLLAEHGLQSVSVSVGENATLAPVAVAGDDNPQDEAGLAAAAGPLRAVGARIVDTNGARMAAARLTGRLINDLAANPVPRGDTARTVWARAVGADPQASPAAQSMARGALRLCQFAVERRGIGEVKGCLQQHHDKFVDYLNAKYWKQVGAGS